MNIRLLLPCRLASRRSSRLFAERFAARTVALALALLAAPFSAYVHAAAISAGASGDWSSTGTWTGGVVPTSADTVTIGNTYTVSVPSGSQTATSVLVQSGGNLTISGGALTTNGTSLAINNQSGGAILLSSGTLNVNQTVLNAEIMRGGEFSMSGGEFNISATSTNNFSVRGNFTISGGDMSWGAGSAARFYGVATTVINVVGDSSTIYIYQPFASTSVRTINYNYEFGASGVSQITTGGGSNTNYSNITVDGTNYTGGAGNHTLMTGVGTGVANGTLTASNFTGYNATINLNGTTYRVTLTSYSTVWDGGGGDTNINTAANWADDLAPNLTNGHNTFTFGTGGSTATINTNLNAAGLVLNRASSFEIASGAGSLTVGSSGITSSGAAHTISEGVILGANQTWDVADSLAVSGAVSGAYNLTKAGTGTLTLSNASNSYTGATTINAGTISISAVGALGSTSGVNLGNATELRYTGAAGDLTRAISVTSGTATVANTGSGVLTLSGGLSKNGTTLTLKGGSSGITVASAITGSAANSDLILDGGSITFSSANSYNGATFLVNGTTLTASVTNALPTANGRTALTMDATGTGGSTLVLGADQSVASLVGEATSSITLGNNSLTIGTTSGNTTFTGSISGNGAFLKDGPSKQVLNGNSTFTGSVTINSGTLEAASAHALGANNTVQVNGGTLLVSADDAVNGKTIELAGSGVGLQFSGNYSGAIGTLTLSANSIIDLGAGSVSIMFTNFDYIDFIAKNYTLSFYNWSGTTLWNGGTGADTDKVYFGPDLSDEALAKIYFYSGPGDSFLGSGFDLGLKATGFTPAMGYHIIPVPEPETWATGLLLLLGGGAWMWRKRRNFNTQSNLEGDALPFSPPARWALRAICDMLPRHRPAARLSAP